MNITSKEHAVLLSIINNDYQTFDVSDRGLVNSPTWTFVCEDSGISGKELSGVISSLTKKGLVKSDLDRKRINDSTIWITKEGFRALNEGGL